MHHNKSFTHTTHTQDDLAFKEKQKQEAAALKALKDKASGKGPLGAVFIYSKVATTH